MSAGAARTSENLLIVGRVAAVASLVLCLLIQYLNHDFFPPDVSVSQYGVGPRGWVFTTWTAVVALAALTLRAGGSMNEHHVGYWLGAGSFGLVLMGIVRTDAGGLQQSFHAKVHMGASILALVALPIGMALAMDHACAWLRRSAWIFVVLGAVALVMVLVSAAGVATPGLDAPHSWAMWQAVAVTLDMLLLAAFAWASLPGNHDEVRRDASVARAGQRTD
ncbi:Protein of unknown function [Nakamurella panacisegetis]|uniref:DUF998 domain-containing protein n=1 Tax=Nakamurella panacisegetis TaxID=1090615 RepID=A0A1H0SE66_9ACTN|nr:DUF998 domain-containing protein [Nakamurella panacisegetis]SDP39987.1 Protein of unknown function [Nakamurella panacisegetis]